jgi:hypothetical protein
MYWWAPGAVAATRAKSDKAIGLIQIKPSNKSGLPFPTKRRPLDEDVSRLVPIASALSAPLGKARRSKPAIGHAHFFGG